jgi:LAO/AO transport system kinase
MTDIVQGVLKGDPRSIAKAISWVENNDKKAQGLMKQIYPFSGKSIVFGITGIPGSGKSTLVDCITEYLRKAGRKTGIIAIDPSSPFSGGAVLGDRVRMMRHSISPEIFIRSMATRGYLGGIAKAAGDAVAILEAAGKDSILIETIGVGQDEVEVIKIADVVIVVVVPGAGDDIQSYKAGLMEIADIFVLNKSDTPDADRMEAYVKSMLDIGIKNEDQPRIIRTVATEARGIDLLLEEMDRKFESLNENIRAQRKKRYLSGMLRELINEKMFQSAIEKLKDLDFEDYVQKIYEKRTDPYSAADEIVSKLKGDEND